jgi:hypothetical protein
MPFNLLAEKKIPIGRVIRFLLLPSRAQVLCTVWPDSLEALKRDEICIDCLVRTYGTSAAVCGSDTDCEVSTFSELE